MCSRLVGSLVLLSLSVLLLAQTQEPVSNLRGSIDNMNIVAEFSSLLELDKDIEKKLEDKIELEISLSEPSKSSLGQQDEEESDGSDLDLNLPELNPEDGFQGGVELTLPEGSNPTEFDGAMVQETLDSAFDELSIPAAMREQITKKVNTQISQERLSFSVPQHTTAYSGSGLGEAEAGQLFVANPSLSHSYPSEHSSNLHFNPSDNHGDRSLRGRNGKRHKRRHGKGRHPKNGHGPRLPRGNTDADADADTDTDTDTNSFFRRLQDLSKTKTKTKTKTGNLKRGGDRVESGEVPGSAKEQRQSQSQRQGKRNGETRSDFGSGDETHNEFPFPSRARSSAPANAVPITDTDADADTDTDTGNGDIGDVDIGEGDISSVDPTNTAELARRVLSSSRDLASLQDLFQSNDASEFQEGEQDVAKLLALLLKLVLLRRRIAILVEELNEGAHSTTSAASTASDLLSSIGTLNIPGIPGIPGLTGLTGLTQPQTSAPSPSPTTAPGNPGRIGKGGKAKNARATSRALNSSPSLQTEMGEQIEKTLNDIQHQKNNAMSDSSSQKNV